MCEETATVAPYTHCKLPCACCCSYRVASFKAISRVTTSGKADASVPDLSSLTSGGDIIVEDLGAWGCFEQGSASGAMQAGFASKAA